LGSLAIAANASVDLQSNDAILHGGDADTVESWLSSGSADGARTGPGLCSTAAANDPLHLHALGYFLNADSLEQPLVSTFDEQPVVATDVLIKYTIVGDADLNGVVNAADYLMIDNGFALNLTGWRNGDFNYDGVVNGDDYSLIDNAFNTQSLAATNGDDASASPFSTATIPYKSIDSRADKTDARSAQPFAQPTEWPSPPPAGPVFATAPLPQSIWDSLDQLIDR
jgi:hypothetical protein